MSSPSQNIFWLSVSRVAGLILLFVAYTQLFRYLGPTTSGQYQFVLSYVTLFGVVIDFGLQQYIIKKISEAPEQAKHFFQNFLAIEVFLALLVYAAMIIVAYASGVRGLVLAAVAVAGSGTVVNGLTYPFLSVLSAFQDLRRVALINFLNSLINAGVIFSAIFLHRSIVFLALNQVIFGLVGLILYTFFIKRHLVRPQAWQALRVLDWNLVRSTFVAAFPFALLVGFSTIYNRIDVVLIHWRLGDTETGLYTAAYKFFDIVSFFPAVVSHSLYPVFAGLMAQKALPHVRENLEKYLRFLIALAIPMGVGGSLLSKPLMLLLAGPKYLDAAPTLAILVWAPVILFIYISANALVISQLTKFAVAITGINVVVNIVGNLILLPIIGIRGAAIMTLVSELLQGIFYFYFVRRKITSFAVIKQAWKPLLASLTMGLAIWVSGITRIITSQIPTGLHGYVVFGGQLAAVIVFGFITYFLVLFILRFFRRDDLSFVKRFLRPV